MPQGWIKLHRKLSKKAFYDKPNYLALWVHILLSANHEENEFMWNGKVISVKKGQFITGRKQLAIQSGIPETTVERLLTFFEKERQIGQQKTTKYRLITIYKWHEYQTMDNKRTTSGQQADTNKNEKNEKKDISKTSLQKNMPIKGYNENQHHDDIPSIGDDGEIEKTEADLLKETNEKVTTLIEWAEKIRGKKFLDTPTQRKMIHDMRKNKIPPQVIKDTFVSLVHSKYWQEQERLPDFKTVLSALKNKK